ncbi:TPA: dUTP diphosphatase [Clostridium perfringens]
MENVLKVKMLDGNLTKIGGDISGEWYDLRLSNLKKLNGESVGLDKMFEGVVVKYKKGDVLQLGLGIATELPEGYEAIVNPRSGTFKNYGFLLTNSQGVIDNTYRGEWMAMVYCTRDGEIAYNDRFLQFRIQKQQPNMEIVFVDDLSETQRGNGGYGSTGVK